MSNITRVRRVTALPGTPLPGTLYLVRSAPGALVEPRLFDAEGEEAALGPANAIERDLTLTVQASGGDFTEPGAASRWLAQRFIAPDITVTVTVAAGTYTCTKVIGHPQGSQIDWTTPGLNGAALTIADFTLESFHEVVAANTPAPVDDPLNRIALKASVDADQAANEALVRAKFKVILEFAGPGPAFAAGSKHLGNWDAFLAINTGTANYGVTTGTGDLANAGDGPGGVATFTGAYFYGFDTGAHCDYGGILNMQGCGVMFGDQYNLVTDFAGGIYGADIIAIGAYYGYRANHGGYFYGDRFVARNVIGAGTETTDTAGFTRVHNCDIQNCIYGSTISWGGSAKFFAGTVKNNVNAQIQNNGDVDARGIQMDSDPGLGITYGLTGNGTTYIQNTFDVVTLDPIVTVITGHSRDVDVKGPGSVFVYDAAATIGNLALDGVPGGQVAPSGWFRNPGAVFSATVNGAVPNPTTATGKYLRDDATWGAPVGVPSYTWAGKPAAAAGNTGLTINISDVGVGGGSLWISDGSLWYPTGPVTLARSAVGAALTGTTASTTIASVSIPANLLGLNRAIEVAATFSCTGSTNLKSFIARLGGSVGAGSAFLSTTTATATTVAARYAGRLRNRGVANSQIVDPTPLMGGTGVSTSAAATTAVDTTAALVVSIMGTLATSSETITLESYEVRLLP